jgi:hypothetical protein
MMALVIACAPAPRAASVQPTGVAPAMTPASSGPASSDPAATDPGSVDQAPADPTAAANTTASHHGTSGSTVPVSRLAACPTRYLQAKVGVSQGTAGTTYVAIDFKNISKTKCTVYGYPGVSLAGGTPVSQIGLAADRSTKRKRTLITLLPGATANAILAISDAGHYPLARCSSTATTFLTIYPPNQTTPIELAYDSTGCVNPVHLLTISALKSGVGSAA